MQKLFDKTWDEDDGDFPLEKSLIECLGSDKLKTLREFDDIFSFAKDFRGYTVMGEINSPFDRGFAPRTKVTFIKGYEGGYVHVGLAFPVKEIDNA